MNETLPTPLNSPRWGNVVHSLTAHDRDGADIVTLATGVSRSGPMQWRAQSFEQAAAWLLCAAHSYAARAKISGLSVPPFSYQLLGFRGQAALYESFAPTLFRPPRDNPAKWARVGSIFTSAVHAWTTAYAQRRPGGGEYGMDPDARLAMPQHYGVKTAYLDWSFDPITALFFALDGRSAGEDTRVIARHFAGIDRPTHSYQVLLPHPCLQRPWRQLGFFDLCLDFDTQPGALRAFFGDEALRAMAAPPSAHWNIVFPVTADAVSWARAQRESVYADKYSFDSLAHVCEMLASRFTDRPELYADIDHLAQQCRALGLSLPAPFAIASRLETPIALPFSDILRYLDFAAASHHSDLGLAYFGPAVRAIQVGMPWSLLDDTLDDAERANDARVSAVRSAQSDSWRWPDSTNPRDIARLYFATPGSVY
jgi:hypothetical protein